MNKTNRKYVRAISVSLGLGLVHYILHVSGWIYQAVGYGIVISLFLYLSFLDDKIFKNR